MPGRDTEITELLSATWQGVGGSFYFKPEISDLSGFSEISINLLIDGVNDLNQVGENQSISVDLKDIHYESQKISISKSSSLLTYPQGKKRSLNLNTGEVIYYWNEITPYINIRIPLNLYSEVDLANLKNIIISFDETKSGAVMFESISVN